LEQTRARRQQIIEYAAERAAARAAPRRSLVLAARRAAQQQQQQAAVASESSSDKASPSTSPLRGRGIGMNNTIGSTSTLNGGGAAPSTPTARHTFYSPLAASVSSFNSFTTPQQQQHTYHQSNSRSPPATARSVRPAAAELQQRPSSGSQTARTMPRSDKLRDLVEARERLDAWQQMEMHNLASQQAQLQKNAKKMDEHLQRRQMKTAYALLPVFVSYLGLMWLLYDNSQEWQRRKQKQEEHRTQRQELLRRAEASEV
jgi:hypothetical protein